MTLYEKCAEAWDAKALMCECLYVSQKFEMFMHSLGSVASKMNIFGTLHL
jgi:hypothetical protein